MATETEQLRLAVTFVDPASEQIKKLRGEMENLTGGSVTLGMGKTGQHAEGLANQFIPLVGGLAQGGSIAKAVTDIVPMLSRSLGAAGAVITAAVLNIDRYRKSLAEYGNQARELNIPAASLKKVEQEWKRAGMKDPQIDANRSAIAAAMGEVQNQASNLSRALQSMLFQGSESQRNAIESLMKAMQSGDYEGTVNAIKEAGEILYKNELELTKSTVKAAEVRNTFYRIMGVEDFNRPMKEIVKATRQEIDDLDKQIKQWGAFNAEVRRATTAITNINDQIGIMTAKYGPILETYRSMLAAAKATVSGLKRGREFRERMEAEPTPRDRWREQRERRGGARVQKQSYSGGNGSFGGAPIVLAAYQDSTDRIRDDVRETVILTEQFRILNNMLRDAGGGGTGVIRASLGMPPGGGGGGYGASGTGTRGTGGGTTGPSTTQPQQPPSVSGMPGVRPGDVGVAAMVRAGMPRRDLLASLQPTTPGGARPIALPSMAGGGGGGGGVAGLIGAGAVGGTGGGAPAGAGPRTDVGALRMPGLPHGVPYGGGGSGVVAPGGGAGVVEVPGGPSRYNADVDAAIRRASQETGVSESMLRSFAQIESGGKPGVTTGSYKGLFQLSDTEFNKAGGSGNIYDAGANAMAAAVKLKRETAGFKKKYGREPTGAELYMIHQQGEGGYQQHSANPERPAWQSMYATGEGRQKGEAWAKKAIWGNLPASEKARFGSVENVTSGQFLEFWKQRYARAGKQAGGAQAARGSTESTPAVAESGAGRAGTGLQAKIQEGYGSTEAAVDDMMSMLGKEEGKAADRKVLLDYINSGGHQTSDIRGRSKAWCAWIVNAALTRQGVENPRSGAAGSYARKGVGEWVAPENARKGDIFVVPGSGGAEGGISHTGFIAGPMNKDGTIPTLSGNTGQNESDGGMVGLKDYPAGRIRIKRLPQPLKDNATKTQPAPIPSFMEQVKRPGKPFIDVSKIDRAMGNEVRSTIKGDGNIEVDVKGPNGTKVTAKGGGIFKRASVNRVKEPVAEKKEAPAKEEPKIERTASRTDEE